MQHSFRGVSSIRRRLTGGFVAALLVTAVLSIAPQSSVAAGPTRYLDPLFDPVRVKDRVYGRVEHSDGTVERLELDLYKPVGDRQDNRPVLIFIHGGGSEIDKALPRNRRIARGFARRGFVAAAINYRKGTSGLTTEAAHDTRAAVRWFKANADRYRVSPEKIIVMGSSAGSMNALHVAFDPEDAGNSGHPGYSSEVAAAVAVAAGSIDPQDIGPDEVPIVMMHARDDTTVPIVQAYSTCDQTKLFGNVCDFFEYAEGGHPPTFLERYRHMVIEQASHFICRNVLAGRSACKGATAAPPA
jgi:dienelactone hydrolase